MYISGKKRVIGSAVKFANWEQSPPEALPMCNFSLSIHLGGRLTEVKK